MLSILNMRKWLEELGIKRAEARATREFADLRVRALERDFSMRLGELQGIFAASSREPPPPQSAGLVPEYPGAQWLGELGIAAFVQSQEIEADALPEYLDLVRADKGGAACRTLLAREELAYGMRGPIRNFVFRA
ncbi:hypothetical protein [Cupriavidus campinensis]